MLASSSFPYAVLLIFALASSIVSAEFQLTDLPYAHNALQPHISSKTLKVHHGKHHAKYVATLNSLVQGKSDLERMTLEQIIVEADKRKDQGLFNNAGQSWNHAFYWKCMKPRGGGKPTDATLLEKIEQNFGSYEEFAAQFAAAGNTAFGSGWAWLVYQKMDGKLSVTKTIGAGNPMTTRGHIPILCMDVWEHAYVSVSGSRLYDTARV